MLRVKSGGCSEVSGHQNYYRVSDLEVRFYGVANQVQSQRDLASTYVLCSCHVPVPNFRDRSVRECMEYGHGSLDQEGGRELKKDLS